MTNNSVAEKRKQQLEDIMKKLEQGVKEVFTSENYKNYLVVMSRFHKYSINNQILILMQKPEAMLVAGYNTWKNLNRHVKAGEKGIQILAPQTYYVDVEKSVPALDEKGNVKTDEKGQPIKETKIVQEQRIRFVPVYVFDVSQTDGEPLPSLLKVSELEGKIPERDVILNALRRVAGIPIEVMEVSGNAKGYYNFAEQRIAIKEGMSDLQTIKTAIHEVAHKLLHDPREGANRKIERSKMEVQAESIAFVVSHRLGLDTSDYSFGYIASWSKDKELTELKESLKEIHQAAEKIIDEVEKQLTVYRNKNRDREEAISDEKAEPVVTIISSEHQAFKAKEKYTLVEFCEKVDELNKQFHQQKGNEERYFKTHFQIDYNMKGESCSYLGNYNIGDQKTNVIEHILNNVNDQRLKEILVPYIERMQSQKQLQVAEPSDSNTNQKKKTVRSKVKTAKQKADTQNKERSRKGGSLSKTVSR